MWLLARPGYLLPGGPVALVGQDHLVNYVDHSVAGQNVRLNHMGVIHHHPTHGANRDLSSARMLASSRCQPFQTVLVVQSAKNRSRCDPHVPGELVAGTRVYRRPGRWLREAGAEARVRAAAIVMDPPVAKSPPQMLLAEWNQEVQTLST